MNNIAKIEKIRSAIRALRNAVEAKGAEGKSYNVAMGISFSPAKGLDADELVKAVEGNRKVSDKLIYGMQAGLKKDPVLNASKQEVLDALNAFEQELALLPQDAGAAMVLEFTVSNPHEQEIIQDAQKAITALEEVEAKDITKLSKKA